MDALVLLAIGLLGFGMVASVLPLLPSGLVSLAGLGLYRWHTSEPGAFVLAALVACCLVALAVDWFGGAIGASAGGASLRTTLLAAVVGLLCLPLGGPIGVLAGVAVTVLALEYRRLGDAEASLRSAAAATVGVLAAAAVQLVCTGVVLAAVLVIEFL
ncbi:DUF456 domain-containing protein [Halarchaeum nitratireducens]|uniref:DUF456 domain-containing protein n=1 Tax=Halarchaeum nitratireducens TaxID=489913 RepID=A0A830GF02_9EURY|nr:DUF456 domain-containing protein [Halarchaeum nitratireducens]GGN23064.1 hypothetical protein GCM10009021_25840 [Halarchaeum nitratireducens]